MKNLFKGKASKSGNQPSGNNAHNAVAPKLKVYLSLFYKDPENVERPFPKNTNVRVHSVNAVDVDLTVGDGGALHFEVDTAKARSAKQFTLLFVHPNERYVVCEPLTSPITQPSHAFGNAPVLDNTGSAAVRAFALPRRWSLRESDWNVTNDGGRWTARKALFDYLASKKPADLGTAISPVKLVLDPHWQFLRFEYFDRFFGHASHSHKPTTAPPLFVEGYHYARLRPDIADVDTHSNWVVQRGTNNALVQCVPWIVRAEEDKKHKLVAAERPDRDTMLVVRTPANVYARSTDADTRALAVVNPAPPVDADRLKLYDMPRIWMSRNQYGRVGANPGPDAHGWYQDIAGQTTSLAAPLAFCLDDIVLLMQTNAGLVTPTLTARDLPLVLFHTFAPPAAGTGGRALATFSPEGIYKPAHTIVKARAAAKASAIADKKASVRIEARVAAQAVARNDVRAKHVGDPQKNEAEKARAREIYAAGNEKEDKALTKEARAITQAGTAADGGDWSHHVFPFSEVERPPVIAQNHLVDYPHWTRAVIAGGNVYEAFDQRTWQDVTVADDPTHVVGARAAICWIEATGVIAARPARVDKTFFSGQPHFEQEYSNRYTRFASNSARPIGRFDVMLFRCCDHDNGDEKAVNLNYFRYSFVFTGAPADGKTNDQYAGELAKNLVKRWNGPDGTYNAGFAEVLPDVTVAPPRWKLGVRWVAQSLPESRASMRFDIQAVARASVTTHPNNQPSYGTGKLGPAYYKLNATDTQPGRFSTAHESGHVFGLPDEYGESSTDCSYYQPGLRWNLPGDPYSPADKAAMMMSNQEIRARHFWHAAEWAREVLNVAVKVKHGAYDEFKMPRHPQAPKQSYVWWPCKHQLVAQHGTRGAFDLFLYMYGKDHTRVDVLPTYVGHAGTEVDGVMIVVVNLKCEFSFTDVNGAIAPTYAKCRRIANALVAGVDSALNKKWYVTGTAAIDVSNGAGGSVQANQAFTRCLLQFSPRVIVRTFTSDKPEYLTSVNKNTQNAYETQVDLVANACGKHFDVRVAVDLAPAAPAQRTWYQPPQVVQPVLLNQPPPPPQPQPVSRDLRLRVERGNNGGPALQRAFAKAFRAMVGVPEVGIVTPNDLRPMARLLIPNATVVAF